MGGCGKNVLLTDSGRPLVAPTENSRESLFFYSSPLFSVMLSLSKHLAEAYLSNSSHHTFYYSLNFLPRKQSLQKQRHYLTLAEWNLNNRTTSSRGRRKSLFPRDSQVSLGMTGCERRQRIKNKKRAYKSINGTYAKVFCHVERAFHLAEALLEKRHY